MKEYVRLITILLIPLLLVLAYSSSGFRFSFNGLSISKLNLSCLSPNPIETPVVGDSLSGTFVDTLALDTIISNTESNITMIDTTGKRILFFGDSMIEGLSMRFADYARENGHELYTVCWYGSTTTGWANNLDTLHSFLRWSEADYVVVSLGGNELKVKDLENRAENIRIIQRALGSRPTIWVAPPSWVKNPTITGVIRGTVGEKRYFDSTKLTYTRGSDKMHPTFGSASRWMDSIAVWMSSPQTAHPIKMDFPKATQPRKWKKKFMFPKK
ncbi:MAG: SGNH/GDSL hydrolase family protein [Bacteroidaceae bacterium]|nr:SGNH/GDSL hydrolase family protein [Bacteroidaceae bacterium]